jgi:hypothetical protein
MQPIIHACAGLLRTRFAHTRGMYSRRRIVREAGEKCRALGSGWRAMTEVDSLRFAMGLGRALREL